MMADAEGGNWEQGKMGLLRRFVRKLERVRDAYFHTLLSSGEFQARQPQV
jgi:hypothetical protein